MKIGFDAKRAFLNKSGLGNYSRFIIQSLIKYFPENDYSLFTTKVSSNLVKEDILSRKIISPKSILDKRFSSYWRTSRLPKEIESLNLDIYHGLSGEIPHKLSSTGTKSVVTIHDLIFLRYPELYKKIDKKIYEAKFRYASNHADKIIAISQQTKSDIIEFFNTPEEKISVLYQGCNEIFQKKSSEIVKDNIRRKYSLPENYLLYLGTIEERKNLLSIIKALHTAKIDIPLVVVGNPKKDYYKKISYYITANRINNVIFLKGIPTEELPTIYQMAEIFIYPSIFEGFGIPVLEALYSGVPVITSKDGCFSEAGGPDSLYINPYNYEEISDAILRILANSDYRNSIIRAGFEHTKNFTHKELTEKLINIYNSL